MREYHNYHYYLLGEILLALQSGVGAHVHTFGPNGTGLRFHWKRGTVELSWEGRMFYQEEERLVYCNLARAQLVRLDFDDDQMLEFHLTGEGSRRYPTSRALEEVRQALKDYRVKEILHDDPGETTISAAQDE